LGEYFFHSFLEVGLNDLFLLPLTKIKLGFVKDYFSKVLIA